MNAMKCDRCGAYYDEYGDNEHSNTLYLQNKGVISKQKCDKSYDLCPICMKKVQDWVENRIGGADIG